MRCVLVLSGRVQAVCLFINFNSSKFVGKLCLVYIVLSYIPHTGGLASSKW